MIHYIIAGLNAKSFVDYWLILKNYPRARTKPQTSLAPAPFNTRAHSFKVAPVVATSSTRMIFLPIILFPVQEKLSVILHNLLCLFNFAWGLSYLFLIRFSGLYFRPKRLASIIARRSAWLKPRQSRRFLCSGTGIKTVLSGSSKACGALMIFFRCSLVIGAYFGRVDNKKEFLRFRKYKDKNCPRVLSRSDTKLYL